MSDELDRILDSHDAKQAAARQRVEQQAVAESAFDREWTQVRT